MIHDFRRGIAPTHAREFLFTRRVSVWVRVQAWHQDLIIEDLQQKFLIQQRFNKDTKVATKTVVAGFWAQAK